MNAAQSARLSAESDKGTRDYLACVIANYGNPASIVVWIRNQKELRR